MSADYEDYKIKSRLDLVDSHQEKGILRASGGRTSLHPPVHRLLVHTFGHLQIHSYVLCTIGKGETKKIWRHIGKIGHCDPNL